MEWSRTMVNSGKLTQYVDLVKDHPKSPKIAELAIVVMQEADRKNARFMCMTRRELISACTEASHGGWTETHTNAVLGAEPGSIPCLFFGADGAVDLAYYFLEPLGYSAGNFSFSGHTEVGRA